MSAELEYIVYNKHRLAVRGDRNKYQEILYRGKYFLNF